MLAVILFLRGPLGFDIPVLGKFNFKGGGQIPLPLFSLWFALTIYTSAFIAENVRAGISSVSKGQLKHLANSWFETLTND